MAENTVKNPVSEGAESRPDNNTEILEAEILRLTKQLEQLDDNSNIGLSDYIEVMSLVPYRLNLSTERLGKGRQFSFSTFGEVKRILYNDLASILENYRSFLEQGKFYILNEKVVRRHGLDDLYTQLLSKEMIDKILTFDPKMAISLYEHANEYQREVIDRMLIQKIKTTPDGEVGIDFNIIAQIKKIGGRDIAVLAQEARELDELSKS